MFQFFLWIIFILGNIRTVWHMKSWYSSKSLWDLSIFIIWSLNPKCPNSPKPKICPRSQNVLIPSSPKISQGAKCPIILNLYGTNESPEIWHFVKDSRRCSDITTTWVRPPNWKACNFWVTWPSSKMLRRNIYL